MCVMCVVAAVGELADVTERVSIDSIKFCVDTNDDVCIKTGQEPALHTFTNAVFQAALEYKKALLVIAENT